MSRSGKRKEEAGRDTGTEGEGASWLYRLPFTRPKCAAVSVASDSSTESLGPRSPEGTDCNSCRMMCNYRFIGHVAAQSIEYPRSVAMLHLCVIHLGTLTAMLFAPVCLLWSFRRRQKPLFLLESTIAALDASPLTVVVIPTFPSTLTGFGDTYVCRLGVERDVYCEENVEVLR